jgi:hypothetical protein
LIDPHISEASVSTTNRMLRQFAGLWILVFGGLACWHGLVSDRRILALIFAVLMVPIGLLGLAKPQAVRLLFTGLMAITYPIGWVVSNLLLLFLFYAMFVPLGLFFRLIGRDVLARRRLDRSTHWLPKAIPSGVRSYFRQS